MRRKRAKASLKRYLSLKRQLNWNANRRFQPDVCYSNSFTHTSLLLDGRFEQSHLEALSRIVFPKLTNRSVCLDIGAYIGNHTLFFAEHFDRVFSFEPYSKSFQLLKFNTESHHNIFPLNYGCSNFSGKVSAYGHSPDTLSITQESPPPPAQNRTICESDFDVFRLDDLDFIKESHSIDFIKIDVEGSETTVIEGAQNLLKSHSPVIACEVLEENVVDGHCQAIESLKQLDYSFVYEFKKEAKFEKLQRLLRNRQNSRQPSAHLTAYERRLNLKNSDLLTKKHHSMVLCSKFSLIS